MNKRTLLKGITIGSWATPAIASILLPAHAVTSAPDTVVTTSPPTTTTQPKTVSYDQVVFQLDGGERLDRFISGIQWIVVDNGNGLDVVESNDVDGFETSVSLGLIGLEPPFLVSLGVGDGIVLEQRVPGNVQESYPISSTSDKWVIDGTVILTVSESGLSLRITFIADAKNPPP